MLKINTQDYNYLYEKIKECTNQIGLDKIKKHYDTLEYNKTKMDIHDTRVRLIYDIKNYYDSKNKNEISRYIVDNLYLYLNDSHITNALLKIGYDLNLY